MLRGLVRYEMKEVIETKHQVEKSEDQSGDAHYNFHNNVFGFADKGMRRRLKWYIGLRK
jgi:hypothetical protein